MLNLNIDIHNFGPINQANIELKKLNIIAGINGSGKTTSSKLLYCFLESNSDEGDYLANKSIYNRFEIILETLKNEFNSDSESLSKVEKLSNQIPNSRDRNFNKELKTIINKLKIIINNSEIQNKNEYNEQIIGIEKTLEINNNERRKFFNVSNTLLKSEFNINDLKINENTDVHFYGKQNDCKFSCNLNSNDNIIGFKIDEGNLNCLTNKNIIYIDSQSIFDVRNLFRISYLKNWQYHLRVLSKNLYLTKDNEDVSDSLFNEKSDECLNKINSLIGGFIYYDADESEFLFKKDDNNYHMKNTASGVKQLGIIQILLSNRILTRDSFLIMDEPETHLHPKWQVKLAKLVILLIKELNITVFINSHSPQFIEALEVLSGKYGLVEESIFYLSEESENNLFNFREIERKNLNVLYDNLGNPYDEIDEIRIENAFNGIE